MGVVKVCMGYFSNGTEGMIYEDKFCAHCIHQDGPEGKTGCAVWLAHLTCNYAECNNKDSILHLLIPRDEKGWNKKCLMFAPKEPVIKGPLPEHLLEWGRRHGVMGEN